MHHYRLEPETSSEKNNITKRTQDCEGARFPKAFGGGGARAITDGFALCKYGHGASFRKKVILQNEAKFQGDFNTVVGLLAMVYEDRVSVFFTLVE